MFQVETYQYGISIGEPCRMSLRTLTNILQSPIHQDFVANDE